ncbi:hypothetical protein [Sphingobacterium hotanense]|uniref:hypothetical protein n=1 Tax=Sphingobacterium hotanense TaxID=649196 RepID=UPI0011F1538E|nr:hypothetical protein [Sphingobacterium hotanense]
MEFKNTLQNEFYDFSSDVIKDVTNKIKSRRYGNLSTIKSESLKDFDNRFRGRFEIMVNPKVTDEIIPREKASEYFGNRIDGWAREFEVSKISYPIEYEFRSEVMEKNIQKNKPRNFVIENNRLSIYLFGSVGDNEIEVTKKELNTFVELISELQTEMDELISESRRTVEREIDDRIEKEERRIELEKKFKL